MEVTQIEHVLVVPTSLFHELGYFQGFNVEVDRYLEDLLAADNVSYRPRDEMENDPSFKQLIPYCLFRYTDENGLVHLYQYTRGKGQGESRLHAKQSVGIGGHISSEDGLGSEAYVEGMQRELNEEISINTSFEQRCVGLINDDESEVGRVHLGVVHIFDVVTPDIDPQEEDIIFAGFKPIHEILDELDNYETWSQFCVRALFE